MPQQQPLALDVFPDAIDSEAQRIVAQLLLEQPALAPDQPAAETGMHTVDVNSLELSRPRSVGVEHLGLWAMEQADFAGLLTQMGLNGPQQAAATGSIIGRMAAPGSEQATYRWLQAHSVLGELIDFDYETMGAMALYWASDRLYQHREALESQLFERIFSGKVSRQTPDKTRRTIAIPCAIVICVNPRPNARLTKLS